MRSRSVGVAERDDPAVARVQALGDPLDRAALAGGVATLEDHHHLQALVDDPLLHAHELGLEPLQLLLVLGLGQDLRRGRPRPSGVAFAALLMAAHASRTLTAHRGTQLRLLTGSGQRVISLLLTTR